jgi:hypothetical protein
VMREIENRFANTRAATSVCVATTRTPSTEYFLDKIIGNFLPTPTVVRR